MTKKEDLIFTETEAFGLLYYHNVYSFYGQPVIFSASNVFGQLFFCYSLGCNEKNEIWLVTPISEKRVNQLEQKDLPIVKAIAKAKTDRLLLLEASFNENTLTESWKIFSNLPYLFPDESVFISENMNLDGSRKYTHKIRFSKNNTRNISTSILSEATNVFTIFLQSLLKRFGASNNFYAQDAIEGSFMYRVKVNNISSLRSKGYEIFNNFDNKDSLLNLFDLRKIDLRTLRKLFCIQIEQKLDITLIDEETTESVLTLKSERAVELLSYLDERLSLYLDSTMVPQADDLMEIKKYLSILKQNGTVSPIEFGKKQRQVSYYRDACRLLNLVHDYNKLTPVGLKLVEESEPEKVSQLIRKQFENTECCYIWMINQGVDTITKIDESSAKAFLIENCIGLSESTAKRRAQTLVSWVKSFKS